MKEFGGWVFPDHEQHLLHWMQQTKQTVDGRYAYQYPKLQAATGFCGKKRTALDIGGHIGLWSFYLGRQFVTVHAFEPVAEHRACFERNVPHGHVTLHPFALGQAEGTVAIHTSRGSSGDSYVDGEGTIPIKRLDDVLPADEPVDFIKADCEGFELFALQGGEQTIRRCKPVICVEQKPGRAQKFGLRETEAVSWLQGLGYTLAREMSGDYMMVPK